MQFNFTRDKFRKFILILLYIYGVYLYIQIGVIIHNKNRSAVNDRTK